MPAYPYRTLVRGLLLSPVLMPVLTASIFAQQTSSLRATRPSEVSHFADPVETAAVELPSAPMPVMSAPVPRENSASAAPSAAYVPVIAQPEAPARHRFWDHENSILFATVGAFAAADFCVTRANLASGGRELNPVTRVFSGSTPALASNFALETGGVMAISYMFHKTGHHRLERITSVVDIGASATAVGFDLAHR